MPRQYRILYKRVGMKDWGRLNPAVHAPLYDRPEIKTAIDFMTANPSVEGVAVRLEDELFNIISFTQDAEAPLATPFSS